MRAHDDHPEFRRTCLVFQFYCRSVAVYQALQSRTTLARSRNLQTDFDRW